MVDLVPVDHDPFAEFNDRRPPGMTHTAEPWFNPPDTPANNRLFGLHGVERYQLFPERLARGIWGAIQDVGTTNPIDPATGQFSTRAIEDATNIAGTFGGGGVALGGAAPRGAAGIFGGRLSATADHEALAAAQQMATRGASREDIWNATGWFTGSDGKWRFEIPDNMLWVNPGGTAKGLGPTSVVSHPDLIRAYPQLEKLTTDVRLGVNKNEGTFYSGVAPKIKIEAQTALADARPLAAHELQHAVQNIEGFAYGANPDSDVIKSMVSRALDKMGWKEGDRGYKKLANDAAYEVYRRYYGEVEARNAANRLYLTAEQRKSMPPWKTQDQLSPQHMLLKDPDIAAARFIPVDHDPFAQGGGNGW